MNKKIITYGTIAILILNTFYWINSISQMANKKGLHTFSEKLSMALHWEASKGFINILLITDAVLIAIYFMIILLYKKE